MFKFLKLFFFNEKFENGITVMIWNGLYDLPKVFVYLGYNSNEQDNFASLYDHSKQPYLETKCD